MRWVVAIEVDDRMVADGIDLSDPAVLHHKLMVAYPYVLGDMFRVSVVVAPEPNRIKRVQGYATDCKHLPYIQGDPADDGTCCLCGAELPQESEVTT